MDPPPPAREKFWQRKYPRKFSLFCVGLAGPFALRALHALARTRIENIETFRRGAGPGHNAVFVYWHRFTLPLASFLGERFAGLVSIHRDGEFMARILERSGAVAVRGSSFHSGLSGLSALVEKAREGYRVVLTPDGSRGPLYSFHPGAIRVAEMCDRPIIPVGVAVDRCWTARSWDKMVIPKPFATIQVFFGPPVEVARDEAGRVDYPSSAARAGAALHASVGEAERLLYRRLGRRPQSALPPLSDPRRPRTAFADAAP